MTGKPRTHLLRLTALATLALFATACSPGPSTDAAGSTQPAANNAAANAGACDKPTRTIKHDLGETTINGTPQRVVTLEFAFVDALASIGAKPVGVADDNDATRILPEVTAKIGTSWKSVGLRQSPNLQEIAALKPDLIIADTRRHETIYKQLSNIAPTLSFSSLQASYQDNLDTVRTIGIALNKCAVMDARAAEHEKKMAEYAAQIPKDAKPVLFGVATDKAFTAHDASNYTPGVLEALGLKYALPHTGGDAQAEMNLETLASTNPPILIVAGKQGKTIVDQWGTNAVGQSIQAVKDQQVHFVDTTLWSRFRGLTAAELMAAETVKMLAG